MSYTTLNTINLNVLQSEMSNYHSRGCNFASIAVASVVTDSFKITKYYNSQRKLMTRTVGKRKKNPDTAKKKSQSFVVQ